MIELLTPGNIALGVGALVSLAVALKLVNSEVRKRNVALVIKHAALITRDIAEADPKRNGLDILADTLAAADQEMKDRGWRPLTDEEKLKVIPEVKAFNAALNLGAKTKAVPQ